MTYDLVNLETDETICKYDSLREAQRFIRFNRCDHYALWHGNQRVQYCDSYTGDDDRIQQAMGQTPWEQPS